MKTKLYTKKTFFLYLTRQGWSYLVYYIAQSQTNYIQLFTTQLIRHNFPYECSVIFIKLSLISVCGSLLQNL